jgi:hypothetical protein
MLRLRFVAHPGPFNVLVRVAQFGFWCSHAEAVLPDGRYIGSRFIGGVLARPPDYDTDGFLKEFFLNVGSTPEQNASFYRFLQDQIGKPYDSLAILAFISERDWQAPDSWFCSELIAAALTHCGLFPAHLAVGFNRITPRDLMLLAGAISEVDHVGSG